MGSENSENKKADRNQNSNEEKLEKLKKIKKTPLASPGTFVCPEMEGALHSLFERLNPSRFEKSDDIVSENELKPPTIEISSSEDEKKSITVSNSVSTRKKKLHLLSRYNIQF